jgi:hypothetical protein
MNKHFFICIFVLALSSAIPHKATAFDFWQYPEMADKHAIFLGGFPVRFSIEERSVEYYPPELYLDYLLPVGLPFSAGVFVNSLGPNIFSFGLRPAYHINLNDENSDLYVLYIVNLILTDYPEKEETLLEYGARIGFRRRFGDFFCFCIETGFKLQTIYVGFAIKLN